MKEESVSSPSSRQAVKAAFNVDTAMAYLKKQVDFGPRVPGTEPHRQTADWLAATLRSMGAEVTDVPLTTVHPETGAPIPVRNIFGQFNPEAKERVILVAHYDTRPRADEDPEPANRETPIDGANDGASGVAVALEVARNFAMIAPAHGLDILFADYEDSGTSGNDDTWCIGSTLWASQLPYGEASKPTLGILLDMVGGNDAVFMREYFSETYAPAVNNLVWKAAAEAGHGVRFVNRVGGAINDDHLPLLRAGIPTIDIIEMHTDGNGGFNPTWHTLADNYDNIDPQTVDAVGNVVLKVILKD